MLLFYDHINHMQNLQSCVHLTTLLATWTSTVHLANITIKTMNCAMQSYRGCKHSLIVNLPKGKAASSILINWEQERNQKIREAIVLQIGTLSSLSNPKHYFMSYKTSWVSVSAATQVSKSHEMFHQTDALLLSVTLYRKLAVEIQISLSERGHFIHELFTLSLMIKVAVDCCELMFIHIRFKGWN